MPHPSFEPCDDHGSGEQSPSLGRKFLTFVLTGLFACCGMMLLTAAMVFWVLDQQDDVVCLGAANWRAQPGLPGSPVAMKTPDGGDLWIQTVLGASLSRRRDGDWEIFRGPQFGTESNYSPGGFALAGDRVWTVVDDVLLEFDGRQWKHHPGPPTSGEQCEIAADDRYVWVLDDQGAICRFDGGNWQVLDARRQLVDVGWGRDDSTPDVELTAVGDGRLWLTANRVWCLDGDNCKPVLAGQDLLIDVRFVGRTGDRLWFAQPGCLLWVDANTGESLRFDGQLAAGAEPEDVVSVAQVGQNVHACTRSGLLRLDGRDWRSVGKIPEKYAGISELTAADGNLFAVARRPLPVSRMWGLAAICLIAGALMMCLVRLLLKGSPKAPLKLRLAWVGFILLLGVGAIVSGRAPAMERDMLRMMLPFCLSALALATPSLYAASVVVTSIASGSLERILPRPVADSDLPAAAKSHFDLHAAKLQTLGFRPAGDFRMKQHIQHFSRLLLSDDGKTMAEISYRRLLVLPARTVCFMSLTDDHRYVETAAVRMFVKPRLSKLSLRGLLGASIDVLYDEHRRHLTDVVNEHQCYVLPLEAGDLQAVLLYGHKLVYEDMLQRGMTRKSPYEGVELELPAAESMQAASL